MIEEDRVYYGKYADLLEEKASWLEGALQDILDSISTDSETRPAEHILSRVKSAGSLQEKMKRLGESPDIEHALETLGDIIGVRIVVHFVGDVYELLTRIQDSDLWEVVQVKDYIAAPKANGYRSLHIILAIPFSRKDADTIRVEIQLRTIAQDCWASLEHQLRYKKSLQNEGLIEKELNRCAAQMASADLTMQTLRDMIQKEAE